MSWGQVGYGILFPRDFKFPWTQDFDCIVSWWYEIKGFKPTYPIYDRKHKCSPDLDPDDPKRRVYYKEVIAWEEVNPCPVHAMEHTPWYENRIDLRTILVVNETWTSSCVEDPRQLKNLDIPENAEQVLSNFCTEYKIEIPLDQKPQWWLGVVSTFNWKPHLLDRLKVLDAKPSPNGSYRGTTPFLSYHPNSPTATLDGDFTVEQLDALTNLMRMKGTV